MQPQKITAWSFSRWQTYEECPAKAKYKFIDKLPEPSAPAMARGTVIHKLAEDYLKGTVKVIMPELKNYAEWFKELKPLKPLVEQEWAFDDQWKTTGWFDKNTWCRVKVDVAAKVDTTLFIIDHKTGRLNNGQPAQLDLYGTAGFLRVPGITHVSAQFWYLDHPAAPEEKVYEVAQLPALKKEWENNTKAMLNDTQFAPRPGNACRFCHFKKANGGPCKF
jgi:RecB family exonuclease